ncbi:MAG: sugar-binding domain-containing protein, partial [Duganella sp.]
MKAAIALALTALAACTLAPLHAADWGPFNAEFPAASGSLVKKHAAGLFMRGADAGMGVGGWFKPAQALAGPVALATLDGAGGLCLIDGAFAWCGPDVEVRTGITPPPGQWTHLAASYDGRQLTLYANGKQVAQQALKLAAGTGGSAADASARSLAGAAVGTVTAADTGLVNAPAAGAANAPAAGAANAPAAGAANAPAAGAANGASVGPAEPAPVLRIGARGTVHGGAAGYAGRVAGLMVSGAAFDAQQVARLAARQPDEALTVFETGSPQWPLQKRQMAGQLVPQDAWTLPTSSAAPTAPVARPAYAGPALEPRGAGEWAIRAWSLQAAPMVADADARVASSAYAAAGWYPATVPGTVLTTLVDRGVYPDPAYGLNNMAIPESLSRQDWWYRARFALPDGHARGRHWFVTFKGVNYASQVWVNGQRIGGTRGAFVRGTFDLGPYLKTQGDNVIAVKVSPPPHPGIAQEESMAAGPGENGGVMVQDGPTFMASEGWDWIPSVRDRNSGLWQEVVLRTTGDVRVGDAHVRTALTRADNSEAELAIDVPVTNLARGTTRATVRATIRDRAGLLKPVVVSRTVALAPGDSTVRFTTADFAALRLKNPQLWWPNGYGKPALHDLDVDVLQGAQVSDRGHAAFGIRAVTYELSLVDSAGSLHRVEADFHQGHRLGIRITDARHEAIRKVGDTDNQWATGLRAEAVGTPAIRELADTSLTPYLVLKVNGVRIAARGGNWGMDDFMKRVDRARLEPYFRLHRDANVNIIRNWVGQNTEETFFDLADEYGLMVLNDFWASTQDYNLEPQDLDLFMANARDVVQRFRNHPSIVAWLGRNEGVPQPALNERLEKLIYEQDGTRWYTGSSNRVNLQNSGPYDYQPPESYFTTHAKGFSVEVGVPSFPTLEAFQAAVPASERWPLTDTSAYHDWHTGGGGNVKPFMAALAQRYGAAASLEDFERKTQLMNYEAHRAIFEGMNAGLWRENSGRMLWMTQPAWPSTMWQILSHDYDTHAAYYGTRHASEPVHVQMNLPDYTVSVINNPTAPLTDATVAWQAFGTDGALLGSGDRAVSVEGVTATPGVDVGIARLLARHRLLIVKVWLKEAGGKVLSENVYWPSSTPEGQRGLDQLAPAVVELAAIRRRDGAGQAPGRPQIGGQQIGGQQIGGQQGAEQQVDITLRNTSRVPVLNAKLTLLKDGGERVLPVYWSDNYVALMPGESKTISARFADSAVAGGALTVALRAWNGAPQTAAV